MMRGSSILLVAMIAALCFVGPAAQAAIVTFDLQDHGDGTFDLYASTPIPDSSGIAGFNVDLVNILTATHESPKADDTALFVTRGFTSGRIDLAGPGALFAGQDTSSGSVPDNLIYGIGQTPGTFPTNPLNPNNVGVPWTAPVLIASGTYDIQGPDPWFGNQVLANVFTQAYQGAPPPPEGFVAVAGVVLIPEPATLGLLVLGGLTLLRRRRK